MQKDRGLNKIIKKAEGKPLLEGLAELSQSEWSSLAAGAGPPPCGTAHSAGCAQAI